MELVWFSQGEVISNEESGGDGMEMENVTHRVQIHREDDQDVQSDDMQVRQRRENEKQDHCCLNYGTSDHYDYFATLFS